MTAEAFRILTALFLLALILGLLFPGSVAVLGLVAALWIVMAAVRLGWITADGRKTRR